VAYIIEWKVGKFGHGDGVRMEINGMGDKSGGMGWR
jgi:hypothetical protein